MTDLKCSEVKYCKMECKTALKRCVLRQIRLRRMVEDGRWRNNGVVCAVRIGILNRNHSVKERGRLGPLVLKSYHYWFW